MPRVWELFVSIIKNWTRFFTHGAEFSYPTPCLQKNNPQFPFAKNNPNIHIYRHSRVVKCGLFNSWARVAVTKCRKFIKHHRRRLPQTVPEACWAIGRLVFEIWHAPILIFLKHAKCKQKIANRNATDLRGDFVHPAPRRLFPINVGKTVAKWWKMPK